MTNQIIMGNKLNGLDLFSGIGGLSLALEPWVETKVYCENDRHAQAVLLSRMADNRLHRAPIWDNITTLNKSMLPQIDIIFGGFPCQDISVAGAGKGLEGKRSGLFFEIIRLVKEISPSFVFLENVPTIRTRGLLTVANEFTEMGYDCRWTCITASSIGAPHKRERWFLLAHTRNGRRGKLFQSQQIEGGKKKTDFGSDGKVQFVADTVLKGLEGATGSILQRHSNRFTESRWAIEKQWAIEPDVGRVANGIPLRVDRIKRLGNAVVPQQGRIAFQKLLNLV